MPPTNPPVFPGIFLSAADLAGLITRAYSLNGYKTAMSTENIVADIKKFCDTLQEYDIDEVSMRYDGSGDSGDGDFLYKKIIRTQPQGPTEPTSRHNWLSTHAAKEELVTKGAVSQKAFNRFEDAMWELLPGGWEINDGAFGVVTVDVRKKTIHVEHNERYTEVNTSESTY